MFEISFTVKLITKENCEHLKCVWNIYCVITKHKLDLQKTESSQKKDIPSRQCGQVVSVLDS